MTQEEAFQRLEQMYEFCVDSMDADNNRSFVENAKAIKMALHALCPNDSRYIVVTREQVEGMQSLRVRGICKTSLSWKKRV